MGHWENVTRGLQQFDPVRGQIFIATILNKPIRPLVGRI
jgi:hypothetical protein